MNRNTRLIIYFLVLFAVVFGMMDCAKRMKAKKASLSGEAPTYQP